MHDELAALARAEDLCDQAQAMYEDVTAAAAQVLARAKADAARLLRQALAVIDENVARTDAARREQEAHLAAAEAARLEAEQLLERAREMLSCDIDVLDLTSPRRVSYGVLAELAR